VAYFSCVKLLASLADGHADGSHNRRLQAVLRPDLLILDDFGLKPLRPPAPEDFYDIIISNRALSEFLQLFGDPLLASPGLDRLFDNAFVLTITGASFRAGNRNPELQTASVKGKGGAPSAN
jgi:DNA replication protein DnaC